jgi:hypothetical protein
MMKASDGPRWLIEIVTVIMAIVWVRGEHQGVDESAVAYHVTINGDI